MIDLHLKFVSFGLGLCNLNPKFLLFGLQKLRLGLDPCKYSLPYICLRYALPIEARYTGYMKGKDLPSARVLKGDMYSTGRFLELSKLKNPLRTSVKTSSM